MLNLSGIIVRLGGRTILDRATAALPPRSRVGLIGRNGAGKSTLMRVIAGEGEPDEGSVEMPRGAKIGYVAQEAPAGDATPFETVLAVRSEEHTSELQSLMRISYAVFCLKKKNHRKNYETQQAN